MKRECHKKLSVMIILSMVFVSILSGLFLAQDEVTLEDVGNEVKNWSTYANELFGTFFDPLYGENMWATKVFLFLLLFLIGLVIIPYITGEKKILNFFLSIVISLLMISVIPNEFIKSIAIQYGIAGATILSVIPFVMILILSILVRSHIIARVIWFFYVVYYFTFYIYMLWNLSYEKGNVILYTGEFLPYLAAIIAGILCFAFIGKLREIVFQGKLKALEETGLRIIERGGLLHNLQKEELETSYGGS